MRIAICDDESKCLEKAIRATEQYASARNDQSISFDAFSHPEDLICACEKNGGYDIYILDVVMPDMNGIQLGKCIREAGYDGKIVYLTSSEEYSLDAFRVKAFDYIIKPIDEQKFFDSLDEAVLQIARKKDKYAIVKTKDRSVRISYDSIMYAELTRRTVWYYLAGGRQIQGVTLRTTFPAAMSEFVEDDRFELCGQSMLVNLDHITEIENDAVIFGSVYRAQLGERNCRKLRSLWSEYLFK